MMAKLIIVNGELIFSAAYSRLAIKKINNFV